VSTGPAAALPPVKPRWVGNSNRQFANGPPAAGLADTAALRHLPREQRGFYRFFKTLAKFLEKVKIYGKVIHVGPEITIY
jgi:hypothetical protein